MQFRYSKEIDPSTYETHGLDHGLPLRQHNQQIKEVNSILRSHKDWTKHVSPVKGYKGGIADPFCFVSVTVPECLPNRIEAISYANEYAFLYDGMMPPDEKAMSFIKLIAQTNWSALTSKMTTDIPLPTS